MTNFPAAIMPTNVTSMDADPGVGLPPKLPPSLFLISADCYSLPNIPFLSLLDDMFDYWKRVVLAIADWLMAAAERCMTIIVEANPATKFCAIAMAFWFFVYRRRIVGILFGIERDRGPYASKSF